MFKNIIPVLSVAALSLCGFSASAEDAPTKTEDAPAKSTNAPSTTSTNSGGFKPAAQKKQGSVASKTATFGNITKTDDAYKTALDAHDLDKAKQEKGKPGAFKGTVSGVFEPRAGGIAILNFDQDYRTALTALLRANDFTNFPDLKTLAGKEVLVSGKFVDFNGRVEIVLTNVAQIKVVEAAK